LWVDINGRWQLKLGIFKEIEVLTCSKSDLNTGLFPLFVAENAVDSCLELLLSARFVVCFFRFQLWLCSPNNFYWVRFSVCRAKQIFLVLL